LLRLNNPAKVTHFVGGKQDNPASGARLPVNGEKDGLIKIVFSVLFFNESLPVFFRHSGIGEWARPALKQGSEIFFIFGRVKKLQKIKPL